MQLQSDIRHSLQPPYMYMHVHMYMYMHIHVPDVAYTFKVAGSCDKIIK